MTETSLPSSPAPHAEYRRRARRIRWVLATQPGMRIRALRDLAHAADAKRAEDVPIPVAPLPTGAAQTFADLVRERMDGPVLRYSHRTRLIREAEQRGIGRFEANLIIAAVQHQFGAARCDVEPGASRSSWIPVIVGFCATQCAIAIGAWWMVG